MSRRLAYRPRYQSPRVNPQSLKKHAHQDYLRQRWIYRSQRIAQPHQRPGSSLLHLPWGWPRLREVVRLRA